MRGREGKESASPWGGMQCYFQPFAPAQSLFGYQRQDSVLAKAACPEVKQAQCSSLPTLHVLCRTSLSVFIPINEFFKAFCQLLDAQSRAILTATGCREETVGCFQGLCASWPWEGCELWLMSPLSCWVLARFEIGVITSIQAWENILRSDLKGRIMPFSQDCLFPTGACR